MHCCSVLLCRQPVSSLVSVQKHLSSFAILTDVQPSNPSAVQRFPGQNARLVALCCCAKKLAAILCHCKNTYQDLLLTQVFGTPNPNAVRRFSRAKGMPCCSVQRRWQQCCAPAKTPIKTCYPHRCFNHQTPVQCSTLQGKLPCCSVLLCKKAGSNLVPLQKHP